MNKHLLIFSLLLGTACTQCSDSKKDQKTIKTIIHLYYYQNPITTGENQSEHLRLLEQSYCYKTPEYYNDFSFLYKGNVVDGKLIAKVYKKNGDLFEIPLTTSKDKLNATLSEFKRGGVFNSEIPYFYAKIPYSGEEIRFEVRRINKEKNVDVLLFEKEIEDLTKADWEEAEGYKNIPNGGGFNKESQCHQSMGVR